MSERLVAKARREMKNAYAPYSHIAIGAAVLTAEGRIFSGCNVENASYGLSNCAERTAIFKAVSEGARKLQAIAIVGEKEVFTRPCGACRQVMLQFNPKMRIIRMGLDGSREETRASALLPKPFVLSELKRG
jgi:cytidine deaminase